MEKENKKQVENDLFNSEEKWHYLSSSIPDVILNIDCNGIILFFNHLAIGYSTKEDALGKSIYDFLPKEQHELTKKSIKKVFKTGERVNFETTVIGAKGDIFWFATRLGPIKKNGKIVSILQISTDITAYKEVEKALRKSEIKLQTKTQMLEERIKELNCLFDISNIITVPGITIDVIFQRVADMIPFSQQYPENVRTKIIYNGQEFRSVNFKKSEWRLFANIVVDEKTSGILEIYYVKKIPKIFEKSFSKEAKKFIKEIAERLSKIILQKQAEKETKRK